MSRPAASSGSGSRAVQGATHAKTPLARPASSSALKRSFSALEGPCSGKSDQPAKIIKVGGATTARVEAAGTRAVGSTSIPQTAPVPARRSLFKESFKGVKTTFGWEK